MCMAIPLQVLEAAGTQATCLDADGSRSVVDTSLVGAVAPGDWLLCFLGAAREVVDERRALAVRSALGALASALAGDTAAIDAAFPDLAGREPQLPSFLRQPPEA